MMPKPDDSTLTPSQLDKIRKEARRALEEAGAVGVFPTPVDAIMRVARVSEVEEDIFNPSFIDRLMARAGQTGRAVRKAISKVMGLFHASDGLIFVDRAMMAVKQRFVRLHESAHGFLPWQRPMYSLVQDCENSLDPGTADLFDREANTFASEVLFQLDSFRDEAEVLPFDIFTPVKLAKRFNASNYSAIRQYVSKNHRTCAVVVLNMPVIDLSHGFRAMLRRVVGSESFNRMFSNLGWPDGFTPDDDIGRLVPVNGRRASGKRQLGLKDANGTLHDCIAESFSTGHQVFILIHVAQALTAKRIVLGLSIADASRSSGSDPSVSPSHTD